MHQSTNREGRKLLSQDSDMNLSKRGVFMQEFFRFSKKPLLIFIAILIFSYFIFLIPFGFKVLGNVEKDDWLIFWGSILACGGTFFLGLVALWQNKKIVEANDRTINQYDSYMKLELQNKIPYFRAISALVTEYPFSEDPSLSWGQGPSSDSRIISGYLSSQRTIFLQIDTTSKEGFHPERNLYVKKPSLN